MQPAPVKPGDVLAGKYRVERVLGAGGMGVVAAAWHIELEQRVAIKFLLPEFSSDSEAAARFRREGRAAVRIQSEHIARVLDVGSLEGDVPYIVMEYLDGRDLAAELVEKGSLPVSVAADYLLQACEALAEAHSLGIIHRDLKPANLFLAQRPDDTRTVKILDFGISKLRDTGPNSRAALTSTLATMGSPLYMSPEQLASSRDVDPRADIWSLGVILHEMVSGQPPFDGDTIPQVVQAVMTGTRTPVSSQIQDGVAVEAVIRKCLTGAREARYQDVAELCDALVPLGPPESSLSAARISRVLYGRNSSGSASSLSPRNPTSSQRVSGADLTKNVWATQRASTRSGPRYGKVLTVAAIALAAVGGAAYVFSGSTEPDTLVSDVPASSPAPAAVSPEPVQAEPAKTEPAPQAAPSAEPAGTGNEEPANMGGAPAGSEVSTAGKGPAQVPSGVSAVVTPAPQPQRPVRPKPRPATPASTTTAPSHPPPTTPVHSSDGLPDFGGRR